MEHRTALEVVRRRVEMALDVCEQQHAELEFTLLRSPAPLEAMRTLNRLGALRARLELLELEARAIVAELRALDRPGQRDAS